VGVADPKVSPAPAGSSGVRVDPLVGRLVAGKYRVQGIIGRGGMGNVYRAEQEPLGRGVAIKVLKPDYPEEQDPQFVQRFFLEANAASKLHHPNTITIYDYGRDDDLLYITMELLEGRTVRAMMKEVGAVPAGRTLHIVRQICKSLREAHQVGLVHRDMKPSNVILIRRDDDPDYVKVLDFGLVKFLDSDSDLTKTGTFMGSPKYMAPEQIRRGRCDTRTDVYSLGVLTYQMLSTAVPFDGESVTVLMHHLNDPPPRMKEQNPALDVPARLERAVMRCLEKDPDKRFQTMDALLDELGAIQEELFGERSMTGSNPVELSPSQIMPGELVAPPTLKSPVQQRRGWVVPVVAAAVAVLLGVGTTGVLLYTGGADTTDDDGAGAGGAKARKGAPKSAHAARDDGARDDHAKDDGAKRDGASATAAPTAAPAPDEVEVAVELQSTPPGAEVFEGARRIGLTPLTVIWRLPAADAARDHTFEFRLSGKKSLTVPVHPVDRRLVAVAHFPGATKPGPKKPPGTGGATGDDYKSDPY